MITYSNDIVCEVWKTRSMLDVCTQFTKDKSNISKNSSQKCIAFMAQCLQRTEFHVGLSSVLISLNCRDNVHSPMTLCDKTGESVQDIHFLFISD